MRKLILKFFYLIFPILLLFVFSEIFVNLYLQNSSFYKISNTSNILILGNSHSECALNDSIIIHCNNFSQSGECYFYTFYKLKKILESNPKIDTVVLEYTNNAFWAIMNDWVYGEEYMGNKYPKYSHLISVEDKAFLLTKNYRSYLIVFKEALILKYQILLKNNIYGPKEFQWGGYIFLVRDKVAQVEMEQRKYELKTGKTNTNFEKTSEINILYLKKIVEYCKTKKIKLILIRSPLHPLYEKKFELELTNLLKTDLKDVEFWDYGNYILDDSEFGDLEHLNYKGARRYSKIINSRLHHD
jgi:hypothetical protein